MPRATAPLWRCPRCDARFLVANSPHSCGRFTLDDLFARAEPHVREVFDRFAAMVREAGAATLIPQKSRAVFMTRMRFVNVQVRRSYLLVGFVMRTKPAHARFVRVDTFSPRSHVAYLRVHTVSELDANVRRWIRDAHKSGRYDLRGH